MPMLWVFLLCVAAVKCAVDTSIRKTRLTPATETNKNFVKASHTMTSSCNVLGQNERFEDGLTTERIKCTDVSSSGKLSHGEYSCAGIYISICLLAKECYMQLENEYL